MKSLPIHLFLLLLAFGCNEKISPELNSGGSSTTLPPPSPDSSTSEFYFQVTNQSNVVLNYVLHRTGLNHESTPCKISSTVPLDDGMFKGENGSPFGDRLYDIACYFEAEELALFYNGIKFNIEASPNTCDYVAYTPYSYFERMPGTTAAQFHGIECGEGDAAPDPGDVAIYATTNGLLKSDGGPIGCNEMIDKSTPQIKRQIKSINVDKKQFCAFDYTSSQGPNCDTGSVRFTVHKLSISGDPAEFKGEVSEENTTSCGGKVAACVNGAIRRESTLANATFGTVIYDTEKNMEFKRSHELPGASSFSSGGSHLNIVNFRRGLASRDLDYVNYLDVNETNWIAEPERYNFDPSVMESFSINQTIAGAALRSTEEATDWFINKYGYSGAPLAADPFLAMNIANRTSPFYNFLCLDRAFEIRARIRMVVRDWDRVFPSNNVSLSYISDIFEDVDNRRQDNPRELQVAEVGGIFTPYNDVNDWDDLIPMRRDLDDDDVPVFEPSTWFAGFPK
jgi:hypothetical protein